MELSWEAKCSFTNWEPGDCAQVKLASETRAVSLVDQRMHAEESTLSTSQISDLWPRKRKLLQILHLNMTHNKHFNLQSSQSRMVWFFQSTTRPKFLTSRITSYVYDVFPAHQVHEYWPGLKHKHKRHYLLYCRTSWKTPHCKYHFYSTAVKRSSRNAAFIEG